MENSENNIICIDNKYTYKIIKEEETMNDDKVIIKKIYMERVSQDRKEYLKEYLKEYYIKNGENIRNKNKETIKDKYKNDEEYRELKKAKRREYYLKNKK